MKQDGYCQKILIEIALIPWLQDADSIKDILTNISKL